MSEETNFGVRISVLMKWLEETKEKFGDLVVGKIVYPDDGSFMPEVIAGCHVKQEEGVEDMLVLLNSDEIDMFGTNENDDEV